MGLGREEGGETGQDVKPKINKYKKNNFTDGSKIGVFTQ